MKRLFIAAQALIAFVFFLAACSQPAELPSTGGDGFSRPTSTGIGSKTSLATSTSEPATQETLDGAVSTTVESGHGSSTTTPQPAYAPPVDYTVGFIGGVVWRDVCFRGSQPGHQNPASGCVPAPQGGVQANGFRDPGEPGVPDVKVSLGTGACPSSGLTSAWTDSDGNFSFGGLVSGKYCVSVDVNDPANLNVLTRGGWSFPGPDAAMQTIILQSGESRSDVNFGWDDGLSLASAASTPGAGRGTALAYGGGTPTAGISPAAPSSPTAPSAAQPSLSASPTAAAPTKTATSRPATTALPSPSASATSLPTATQPIPTLTPISPTASLPTSTTAPYGGGNLAATQGLPQTGSSCSDQASFITDVSIPDNTVIPAGSAFTKTWRIRNDGTCTWTPGEYVLMYTGGQLLGAPSQVALPQIVQPGGTVDLSVNLVAPLVPGTYSNLWLLRDLKRPLDVGSWLGVGPDRVDPLYTRIVVTETEPQASLAIPQPSPTSPAAPSTGQAGPVESLHFDPGTTSAEVQGRLNPGESQGYTLLAGKGYALIAALRADVQDMHLEITAQDGAPLSVTSRPDGSSLVSDLPSNQIYTVRVIAGSEPSAYTLSLEIPGLISPAQSGGSSSYGGLVKNGLRSTYLLRGLAGRTLAITLFSPGNSATLSISGLQDGRSLPNSGAPGATTWTGTLPNDQDYLIEVTSPVDPISFTLQVTSR